MINALPKDIIHTICKFLNTNAMRALNLTNKNISRKTTDYMRNNLIYNFEKQFSNFSSPTYDIIKFGERYTKNIKHIKTNDIRILKYFENTPTTLTYKIYEIILGVYNRNYINEITSVTHNEDITTLIIAHSIDHYSWKIDLNLTYFTNLKELVLSNFNGTIKYLNCKSLEKLTILGSFNDSLDHLKFPQLKYLELSSFFNQPIENIEFPQLKYLKFGYTFNQSIENLICPKLKYLILGHEFNQPIEKIKCNNLKYLKFNHRFDHPIKNIHTCNLEYLQLGYLFHQSTRNLYCPKLKVLKCYNETISIDFKLQHPQCNFLQIVKKVYVEEVD